MNAPKWFKHRAWVPTAWALAIVNVGAVWFAAAPGEALHATAHGLLAALFAAGARHLMARNQLAATAEELHQVLDQNEELRIALDDAQSRLPELEERVDFAERLLAQQRDAERSRPRDS